MARSVVGVYAAVAGLYRFLFVLYGALGFDTPPLHVMPVRARTVQELWGERWARPISEWLAATFFRPWARRRRPLVGVLLSFVVSAAFHAYAIWVGLGFFAGLTMTAWTFAYFVAQAVVMSIEQRLGVRRWPTAAGHAVDRRVDARARADVRRADPAPIDVAARLSARSSSSRRCSC